MTQLFRIRGFWPYTVIVFLNAFVDLGHKITIQNTVFKAFDGQTQIVLTAIVNAFILLPFILLFSPAGFLSDRYSKPKVMRASAIAALVIVILITACYYTGQFWIAFALTLALAVQSAIYSPAKYGYIRELVGDQNIAQANALVQAVTIVAILAGTFIFSAIFEWLFSSTNTGVSSIVTSIAPLGWLLIAITLIEVWATYRLTDRALQDDTQRFSYSDYLSGRYLRRNVRAITSKRTIWLPIVGLSMFWAVSQVVLAAFPAHAKDMLGETNTVVIQGLLAGSGLGIIFGAVLAGRISRNYIELGLIPVGALGLAVALMLLRVFDTHFALAFGFIAMGFFGGVFIVPLNSLIQYHAEDKHLGTVLAGNNWVQNLTMLAFLLLTAVFATLGLPSAGLLTVIALVAVAGAAYTVWMLPHSLTRILASALIKRAYHIDVVGFTNLPKESGVLLLGNHASWIDWALVQIACPRPVRFVMLRSIYNRWYLKPLFKQFGAIPISGGSSREALQEINEYLKAGEVVCLFPEGAITKTGQLGKFQSGYQRATEGAAGVIVPFYLRGLWGSRLSKSYSDKLRRNTAAGNKRKLVVAFGKPVPLDMPPEELKQKVFELGFDAWEHYAEKLPTLPLAWLRSAKSGLREVAVVDTHGEPLSNLKMLGATLAFAGPLDALDDQRNLGLLLPASSAGLIANMATLLKGRTVVNINYTTSVASVCAGLTNASVTTVVTSKKFVEKLGKKGIDAAAMLAGRKVVYMEDLRADISRLRMLLCLLSAAVLPAGFIYRVFGRPEDTNATAVVLFSSGSEGMPKGIMLSHKNILANVKQVSEVLNTQEDDVVMGCLPPFHSFGLTVTSFMPLIEGIPVVCHPDPTDVANIAKAISKFKVTILCSTATFLRLYSRNKRVSPLMLESLRVVVSGAEKLPPEVRDAFKMKFSKDIYEGYGATETSPVASVNVPDMLDTSSWRVQTGAKAGSVGLPLPGSSFRIVDPETMQTLPIGEDGLILIAGPQVMLGYINDAEKTAQVIIELDGHRWYKTGDKGRIDEDGFLTIVDRYSRFAKIGGEMISLGAVEEVARSCLQGEEVDLVAVNLPDEKKGEKIIMLVTGDVDGDVLRKQLINARCNSLMIPADIIAVAELPKLGSGKSDFSGSKELAKELLGTG